MEEDLKMQTGGDSCCVPENVCLTWHRLTYPSLITETERNLNVILPPEYQREKKYPVLYLFHGIGGDENEWKNAKPEYILGNLLWEKKIPEFITVFPNLRTRKEDSANPADIFSLGHFRSFDLFREELEESVMPFIKEKFNVLEGREHTAIAGYSMGGRESLYIGLTRTDLFGYIGSFSPVYGIFPYTNNGVTEKGLFLKEEFKLPEKYKSNTFLMLANGESDLVVSHQPQLYHQVLLENNTKHFYRTYPGGHDFQVWGRCLYEYVQHIFKS